MPASIAEQLEVMLTAVLVGEQETETDVTVGLPEMAIVAEADLAGVWVETAVMVALPEAGAVAGAV